LTMDISKLDFKKSNGLIPCIVQDSRTSVVLMHAYMNEEALQKTLVEKRLTFFSRSKQRLWTKGETSGNYLRLIHIEQDCDHDTLLISAQPSGPVCHTGTDTCFGFKNEKKGVEFLEQIIHERKKNPKPGSYTNMLLDSGINKIAQKIGEEAVELIIEAKDDDKNLFLNEAADLMYHYLVLLAAKGVHMDDVVAVLKQRHNKP
jgi:phosphoribosyl-ATP pyrophosphohydrolase/phosphoribosyl-AMP cyclohydrolase